MLRTLRAPAAELPPAAPERVARWVLVALVVFVTYGCLYPFAFAAPAKPLLAWPALPRLGDVVANLAIYAVLGFVAFGALLPRRAAPARIAAVLALCVPLSLAIEVTQAHVAGRHSSALDVVANAIGALGGALAARLFRDAGFRRELDPGTGVGGALLLLALWFAARLTPFVAAFDATQIALALAPLRSGWTPSFWAICNFAALWLVVFRVVAVLAPRRSAIAGGLAIALALTLIRVSVRSQAISPQEIYGVMVAAAAFRLVAGRAWVIAAWLAVVIVREALLPLGWGPARAMNLMPFRPFIHGNIETALQQLLFKCFLYGALAWIVLHARIRAWVAVAGCTLAVLLLEFAQTRIPGRYADITDPIIFLGLALAIRQLDRLDLRHPLERPGPDARNALGGGGAAALQSPPRTGGS